MGDPFAPGGNLLFQIAPIFIGIVFVIVFGTIIFTIFKGLGEWNKNNKSPRLSVPAVVKTKRTHFSKRSHAHNNNMHHSSRTEYYATFEFESGDRTEFRMNGNEYGQLAEGDIGILEFQGTRYLGFERS
ncbi:DUF2500 domain-containing protein [Aquibacillus koreensis]|uniref:DUF2500 domain-containing protein n=1 Tax=Aquibacillus koreensis TaxID=279446 RepID=A0A9X4AKB0_9BACI|nr:DUF2500 domain-containing protein [Aquibacillus koreensis]MCT2537896.1 DUF2500 domain-containing protein [Aquibacillus koreensis]MDC3422664.1 DUF2500 domain-containing protein [Aquibacillus koreensis]